jgi:hypothetical protein
VKRALGELRFLAVLAGGMVLVQLANSFTGGALNVWGLVPRQV